MLGHFWYSLSIKQSLKKKEKRKKIYDSLFYQECCFLYSFSSFGIRFSPCLHTAHWSSFYIIPGLYIYRSISKLHNTIFCSSVVFSTLKSTQKWKKMDLDSASAIKNNDIVWPDPLMITFYDSCFLRCAFWDCLWAISEAVGSWGSLQGIVPLSVGAQEGILQ